MMTLDEYERVRALGKEAGAADERAAVVAYLRREIKALRFAARRADNEISRVGYEGLASSLEDRADRIERCEHEPTSRVVEDRMEEDLADGLLNTAAVLRWLEKYQSANALILLSRLVRAKGIDNLYGLEQLVVTLEDEESEHPEHRKEGGDHG